MNITIEEIDSASMRLIGYTPQPSFVVHFRSAAFSGIARLVPALERADDCLGMEFHVEITQGSVTQFGVLDQAAMNAVEALDTPGSFKVTGMLESQSVPSDPSAQRHAFIMAGEACFCLSEEEMGGLWPEPGSRVAFVAHDVSLWDDAL
ncbi:hypothetical protein RBA41_19785 [Massilia sp. CCM 9210]|uniref:hypothetical protein n=1 Tax=Massilia scottii TaxID=3057166 RepID=UPI002796B1B5|nr:hypothetical protein [Massilia sp. CCM 9210]MDQ1815545.1 hypothetical protein [Massilia sp. CCM 9210]